MDFRIIEDVTSPAYKHVGLWLRYTDDNSQCEFMIKGGDTVITDKYTYLQLNPADMNLLKVQLDDMQGEVKFLTHINNGLFGYDKQKDTNYGTKGEDRNERIARLEKFIAELSVDIHRCSDMLWLMEAGVIFDKHHQQEKKDKWLQAVRSEPKPLPGEQAKLF